MSDISDRFATHPMSEEEVKKVNEMRALLSQCAEYAEKTAKASRELSLAATKLEEAMMWFTKSIARNGLADGVTCLHHNPVQHRDMKPPWCNSCGGS